MEFHKDLKIVIIQNQSGKRLKIIIIINKVDTINFDPSFTMVPVSTNLPSIVAVILYLNISSSTVSNVERELHEDRLQLTLNIA
jgi:hypothetical protein